MDQGGVNIELQKFLYVMFLFKEIQYIKVLITEKKPGCLICTFFLDYSLSFFSISYFFLKEQNNEVIV